VTGGSGWTGLLAAFCILPFHGCWRSLLWFAPSLYHFSTLARFSSYYFSVIPFWRLPHVVVLYIVTGRLQAAKARGRCCGRLFRRSNDLTAVLYGTAL